MKTQHNKILQCINKIGKLYSVIYATTINYANFAWDGVWRTSKNNIWIRILKVVNLSIRSFLNKDLQSSSMSLTYSTVLAIVPAFAMLFAIARGFGMQKIISEELFVLFPSQSKALTTAMQFVDSYLQQASQGIFVGVGIVFLLWTIISLLGNIETVFNQIWEVKKQRTLYRKITDYTSICLLIPILMVCSAGISLFMSTDLFQSLGIFSHVINIVLDATPFFLSVLAFTLSFLLIPNTKVEFKYALLSGIICGIAFGVLQYLFMSGQLYVAKYNAIYGTFAFLPLLLIWLQLSWLILLFGCLLTYSAQNVFSFNYTDDILDVSEHYLKEIATIALSIIIKRHLKGLPPQAVNDMSAHYDIPLRLLNIILIKFQQAKLIYYVVIDENDGRGVAPAIDCNTFTLSELISAMDNVGKANFVPGFFNRYKEAIQLISPALTPTSNNMDKIKLADLPINYL